MAGSPKADLALLLQQVLDDPLGLQGEDHIREWLEALRHAIPLWCWQAEAYAELNRRAKSAAVGRATTRAEYEERESRWLRKGFLGPGEILPSAYPAQVLVHSVLRDDDVLDEYREVLSPLQWAIHLRRAWLTDRERSAETPVCPPDWNPASRYTQLLFWSDLQDDALRAAGYDPDEPLGMYDLLGRMLVEDVESWVSAPDKEEREKRRERLWDLSRGVAVELGVEAVVKKSGQPKGPRADILKALIKEEGEVLLELCWDLFPLTVANETREALRAQGIHDDEEQQYWTARLALPVLSRCELLALKAERREERPRWKPLRGLHPPTPLRLAVWVEAHRLGLSAATLTRKARGHDAAYFKERTNPIDEVC